MDIVISTVTRETIASTVETLQQLATREINPLLGNVATTENELLRCRYNEYVKGLFARLAEAGDKSVLS
jgi:hypothetical protein